MEINKIKKVRDDILVILMEEGFTVEESEYVLKMCIDDINAAVKRSKFSEVRKDEE